MPYLLSLMLFLFASNCGTFICFISGYGQKYGQNADSPLPYKDSGERLFNSIAVNNWNVKHISLIPQFNSQIVIKSTLTFI